MKKIGENIFKYITLFYWGMSFLLIPLYFENAYFNISNAKTHIFIALTAIMLFFILIASLLIHDRSLIPNPNISIVCFIILGLTSIISSWFSVDFKLTFLGLDGWGIGSYEILCFSVFTCLMTFRLDYRHNLWLSVVLFNCFIFIIGILHSAEIDVFNLHNGIYISQYHKYISTIGNENWYVGYLCLLVPVICVFYFSCKTTFSKVLYLIFLSLALLNVVLGASDGIFVGFGLCALFAIPYVFRENTRVKRLCILVIIYGISLLFVDWCPWCSNKKTAINGLSRSLLDWKIALFLIAFGLCGYLILCFYKFKKVDVCLLFRISVILAEAALFIVVIYYFIDMIINFSDSWGSYRGKIWRCSFEVFDSLPVLNKIIGVGPGALRQYYNGENSVLGSLLLVSHNEPLQYLLTTGIIGFICWLIAWGNIVFSYFKYKLWNKNEIVFFLPLMAYLGQSMVNSPTVTNFSILSAIMACYFICLQRFSSEGGICNEQ